MYLKIGCMNNLLLFYIIFWWEWMAVGEVAW